MKQPSVLDYNAPSSSEEDYLSTQPKSKMIFKWKYKTNFRLHNKIILNQQTLKFITAIWEAAEKIGK